MVPGCGPPSAQAGCSLQLSPGTHPDSNLGLVVTTHRLDHSGRLAVLFPGTPLPGRGQETPSSRVNWDQLGLIRANSG